MTAATWWAIAFIVACVAFIVWVRIKYPLPDPSQERRPPRRRRSGRKSSPKARAR
ncbi:MAG: hypothetical protein RMM06_07430 [Armatimonadota bacterium]|nr:hypothetical protein [bacterium]MCS7310570.1 hypothetical protein [Armatimonadota bacterium]MDW8105206.1 hypothetical protein [Armatimonadota bacterium]MDW8290541.1 hypothetical protein [Armatimonadota bacterium]